MIFRQRMPASDFVLYVWTHTQTGSLYAFYPLANLWSARASKLSAWTVTNWHVLTAMAAGIFIGVSVSTFFSDNLIFTIGYVVPLWSVVVLQLSLSQGSSVRQREEELRQHASNQLSQQEGQNQIREESMFGIMSSIPDDKVMTLLVEDALRHLHDRSYLGQHQLAQLQVIKRMQWSRSDSFNLNTHLSLGHTLHSLLMDIVGQLRPTGPLPSGAVVPPREWHPYLILHANYVQGERTRETMARLYISEGTYNRTRRRAICSLARAIWEIEQQTRTHSTCS